MQGQRPRPKSADCSSSTSQKYKDTFNFVAFHSKVNIRRKFRSKNSRFANFVDIENDFGGSDLEAYRGPKLKKHETVTPAWIEQLQTFFVTKQGRMHRKYVYKLLCLSEEYYRN